MPITAYNKKSIDYLLQYDKEPIKEIYNNINRLFDKKVEEIGGKSILFKKTPINPTPSFLSKEHYASYKLCCDKFNTIIEKIGDRLVERNTELMEFF
ncbi:hypothetical protein FIV31_05985 [Coxiella endosymbiont of Ornithodoros amblus]|uniref:hypothetical protein n=1 Tax=Coxiella endosymbiont of Ornithodoros amblus TaxID=1656166 RepID=UPI00244E00CB|nr:hypothetical protein [Coxiella endosymbiont of Ornithodoros amblus]MBW5802908.1 hypothetical protein [Coxiella endosymbiont of Ornithodoros amblus]